jgi:hypothetical protein
MTWGNMFAVNLMTKEFEMNENKKVIIAVIAMIVAKPAFTVLGYAFEWLESASYYLGDHIRAIDAYTMDYQNHDVFNFNGGGDSMYH